MSRLVIWYSCGAASATAVKITLADKTLCAHFDEVVVAYCYIKQEHPDNGRFLAECEKWFGQKVRVLVHPKYYGDLFKVFDKNYMRTPSGSPCTRALKKQVREKFQRPDDVHVFGYTLDEEDRANDFIDANPAVHTFDVLIDRKISKENCLAMVANAGIELPVMYKLGYEHNNCVGCVKGGMGYWNKIRVDFPEAFDKMAKFERIKGYTVLKDKNGPLYLDELDPKRGRFADEPKIECGIFCEMAEAAYKTVGDIL